MTKLKPLRWAGQVPSLIWSFTESDFATFVFPDTAFGILGAFAATSISGGVPPSTAELLRRLPLVIIYNWSNVLSFDLANQRAPESVAEDRINKPWRPIPAGKITSSQTRRVMLALIPLILGINYYLGIFLQGTLIHIIVWLYNDLRGMDEAFLREILISVGYAMFNSGSLQIALGDQARINRKGLVWIGIISGVILTTMQIQDLKDQEGDRARGRKTIVLLFGEDISRGSIAFFVCFWGSICALFWSLPLWACVMLFFPTALVAWRVWMRRNKIDDRQNWQLWCLWLVCLYSLPVVGDLGA